MTALTPRQLLAIELLATQYDNQGHADLANALRTQTPESLAAAQVALHAIEAALGLVNLQPFKPAVQHYIDHYQTLRDTHRVGFHDEWKAKQAEGERLLQRIKDSSTRLPKAKAVP